MAAELPDDVRERLAEQFAGAELEAALGIVGSLEFGPRVVRSVVFLGAGRLDRLEEYADVARKDWRDVIFWAEYEDYEAKPPRQVRSMTEPFPKG